MVLSKFIFPNLRGYQRRWLKSDLMAAMVVTAIAIPESLGFAVIVGLPVQTGLYCALLAPIVFAAFVISAACSGCRFRNGCISGCWWCYHSSCWDD
ncbi:SulP family inorganic anion transporter [bacterium]|nr:MAG: SulP family inorganic anion transporter [bacterium]